VLEAEEGNLGLEMIKQENPSLVLLDMQLPEMDGITFMQACQMMELNVPVIALSSVSEVCEIGRAYRYGVIDYLKKPFDTVILLYKIQKILNQGKKVKDKSAFIKMHPVT
jgi:two-component system, NtrC family, nitrogen regulation response regulator NtrX